MIKAALKAIRAVLVGSTSITNTVSTRVYAEVAPSTAALPYIVLSIADARSSNITPRDTFDVTVIINCIGNDALVTQTLADSARLLLHELPPNVESGWIAHRCQHTTTAFYSETIERVQFFYTAAQFRLQAAK